MLPNVDVGIGGTERDCLGGVDDAAAAHCQHEIDFGVESLLNGASSKSQAGVRFNAADDFQFETVSK